MASSGYWRRSLVKRPYTHELIARFANECQDIAMLGSAELVELAEATKHDDSVSAGRAAPPPMAANETPDTVVLGCTHFPLLRDELLQVTAKDAI